MMSEVTVGTFAINLSFYCLTFFPYKRRRTDGERKRERDREADRKKDEVQCVMSESRTARHSRFIQNTSVLRPNALLLRMYKLVVLFSLHVVCAK